MPRIYSTATMNIPYLKTLIRNHVKCAIEFSDLGSKHPDDMPIIEEEYKQSRTRLFNYIDKHSMKGGEV